MTTQYETYDARLGNRRSRKVGNNTYLQRRHNGDIAILLHSTDVVTYHPNNSVTLDSGGWATPTTKDRIHAYTPERINVSSQEGEWLVRILPADKPSHDDDDGWWEAYKRYLNRAIVIPFVDGMTIDLDTYAVSGVDMDQVTADRVHNKRIKSLIAGYMRNLTESVWQEVIEQYRQDHRGDCLFCQILAGNPDADVSSDHLISHLEEQYYMVSLAGVALRSVGYKPEYTLTHLDTVKRALRRYFKTYCLAGAQQGVKPTPARGSVAGYRP